MASADAVRRVHSRHALAVRTDRSLHINTPVMGPRRPTFRATSMSGRRAISTLLEISSNEGLGHHFGEGNLSFRIAPDDLKAGRFDRVELTTDAY